MDISYYLGNFRKESGMTQEQVAEHIGVSRQAISKWERGEGLPELENLVALSDLYDVSTDELLRGVKFLPKPFVIGEENLKRNLIFGFLIALFLAFLMSGGKYLFVFVGMFILINLVSVSMLKEGRIIVGKKHLDLLFYPSTISKLVSLIKPNPYVHSLEYHELASFEVSYKARVRFSPVDFGPDAFFITLKTKAHAEYRLDVSNRLLDHLVILCDFMANKGVDVIDGKGVLDHLKNEENIYNAMHDEAVL